MMFCGKFVVTRALALPDLSNSSTLLLGIMDDEQPVRNAVNLQLVALLDKPVA